MLVPGDDVYVFNSEIVPTDMVVSEGSAVVDESILTGESHPVQKSLGDIVYAGSRNLVGDWMGRVSRTNDDTMHARMIHMIDEAQMEKSATRW